MPTIVPVLYVVATPIGNLEDITLRALRVLKEVKLVAAEDTRTTRHLLEKYQISTKLISYFEHNKQRRIKYLLDFLKREDIALVSEAGMPGLSDTGYELIAEAIKNDIKVVGIPGASAIVLALVVSGLPIDQFVYLGFLPRKETARKKLIKFLASEIRTMVFFEAPHRLINALGDIREIMGDRKLVACRELTKLHEEVFRGTVTSAIDHFKQPRGEFTLILEGLSKTPIEVDAKAQAELKKLYHRGFKANEATKKLAQKTGLSKRKLYKLWVSLLKETNDEKRVYSYRHN